MLLRHLIFLTKHGSSLTVSVLLKDILLHCAHSTHLRHDPKESIVYVSTEQLPDDHFAIEYDSILLPFVQEPHSDRFLHPSNDDSSDTNTNSLNACMDPEQPPFWTRICGTPHLDNCLAGKSMSKEYFDIFDNEIDL
jgi:hypothetical protein